MFPQKYVRYDSFETDTIFMAVDLAISTKEQADYSAICVLGRSNDRWLIKYVQQKKDSFHGIMNWIKEIAAIYNPDIIGIEKVAYQDAMIQSLITESNLNIVGIPVKTDKITRAMALQVRYETGLIFHEKNLMGSDFERQLFSFPSGEHDDMVDATVHAFNLQSQFASANVYGVR
jgi:predicted phage terminase large subunit-like protein